MNSDTVNVSLTAAQIEVLRGVMFEYYSQNEAFDATEEQIRLELEILLANAEDEMYFSSDLMGV
jgi:hypothetical protein